MPSQNVCSNLSRNRNNGQGYLVGDIALLSAYHQLETVEDDYDVFAR
jgi:hypothetical protein